MNGPDPKNRAGQVTGDLLEVIKKYWGRNHNSAVESRVQ